MYSISLDVHLIYMNVICKKKKKFNLKFNYFISKRLVYNLYVDLISINLIVLYNLCIYFLRNIYKIFYLN